MISNQNHVRRKPTLHTLPYSFVYIPSHQWHLSLYHPLRSKDEEEGESPMEEEDLEEEEEGLEDFEEPARTALACAHALARGRVTPACISLRK